jgi:predicted RNA-binding protein YlxR (DUF448 family)
MTGGPVRTCVGCRTRREQHLLQRFVRQDDRWSADAGRRREGRGVYLCGPQCAEAVIKNKRFPGFGSSAIAHYASEHRSGDAAREASIIHRTIT